MTLRSHLSFYLTSMKNILRAFGLTSLIAGFPLVTFAQNAPQAPTSVTKVDAATTNKLLGQSGVVLLDVRTPAEFAAGHVQGAQNLDFRAPDFAQRLTELDPTKTYVLYCASGNRSGQASQLMQEQGFPKVVDAGAFKTLKEGGLKTE